MSDWNTADASDSVMEDLRRFMGSRVLLTAAELDVFSRLDQSPAEAMDLAERLGADIRALTRLLDCLVTLGYLDKQNGQYQLTPAGRQLSSKHGKTVLPMALHLSHVWEGWSNLTETVRRGINPDMQPVTDRDETTCRAFIGAMDAIGTDLAEEIAADLPLTGRHCLLDVGGGCGTYTVAFLRRNQGLRAVLFDLPKVMPMAEDKLAAEGLRDRVELRAGDFYRDELPAGCDAVLLSAIIHQNSPEENLELFSKIHRALEPGGLLIIRDHIMDETRTDPPAGATFAINMLVNTSGGDTYTRHELEIGLKRAGFDDIRLVRSGPRMDCLLTAHRP